MRRKGLTPMERLVFVEAMDILEFQKGRGNGGLQAGDAKAQMVGMMTLL